ncbi:MAG: nitrilase family protein [Bacteroidia bacterium]|nr:nitrilase family protein [Bacteroidia bacterium]MDW8347420.1 nitrilase-related carbon-nitrogen hydrolase [Bacteroidia bacterium]
MESQTLTISLIQTNLHWESPEKNLAMFEEWFKKVPPETDIVVLPEMFTTGFSMNTQLAFTFWGEVVKWLEQQSTNMGGKLIVGSGMYDQGNIWGGNDYVNMFFACENSQEAAQLNRYGFKAVYAKRHLFRMAGEDRYYSKGERRGHIQKKGFNIFPLICYDLRFPVWSANYYSPILKDIAYDVYIYVANWPKARIRAWDVLLPARAVENWAYCIGVNRVGVDGKGIEYCGHSGVYDYKGEQLAFLADDEGIVTITLDKTPLHQYRANFPAYLDADAFILK